MMAVTAKGKMEWVSLNLLLSCLTLLPISLFDVTISNLNGKGHPSHQLALPFDQMADASTNRSVPDVMVGHHISETD